MNLLENIKPVQSGQEPTDRVSNASAPSGGMYKFYCSRFNDFSDVQGEALTYKYFPVLNSSESMVVIDARIVEEGGGMRRRIKLRCVMNHCDGGAKRLDKGVPVKRLQTFLNIAMCTS